MPLSVGPMAVFEEILVVALSSRLASTVRVEPVLQRRHFPLMMSWLLALLVVETSVSG